MIEVKEFTISHILEQWYFIFHARSLLSYAETTLFAQESGDAHPVSALDFFENMCDATTTTAPQRTTYLSSNTSPPSPSASLQTVPPLKHAYLFTHALNCQITSFPCLFVKIKCEEEETGQQIQLCTGKILCNKPQAGNTPWHVYSPLSVPFLVCHGQSAALSLAVTTR